MEGKLSRAQQEAKAYVDNHQLEKLVGEMVNALVQAKDASPPVFMIKYLASSLSPEELQEHGISIEGSLPQAKAPAKFPVFPENSSSLLKKFLSKDLWEKLHEKKTKHRGDFYSVIRVGIEHADFKVGLLATDEEAYSIFGQLFLPIVEEVHSWSRNQPHKSTLDPAALSMTNLDDSRRFIKSSRVRVLRNFTGFPFAISLNQQERERVEAKAVQLLNDHIPGKYVSLADESEVASLPDRSFQRDLLLQGTHAYNDWPKARGIFVVDNWPVYVNVNGSDHLEMYATTEGADLRAVWEAVVFVAATLESHTAFAKDNYLGYLTTNPSQLGTTMKISFRLEIPNLQALDQLRDIISAYPADFKVVAENLVEVFNVKTLGLSEIEIAETMGRLVSHIIAKEKELMGEEPLDVDPAEVAISPDSLLAEVWSEQLLKQLQSRKTPNQFTILDCISKTSSSVKIGLIPMDTYCYSEFSEIFDLLVEKLHAAAYKPGIQPSLQQDSLRLYVKQWSIKVARNLKASKMMAGMKEEDRRALLSKVQAVLPDLKVVMFDSAEESEAPLPNLEGEFSQCFALWPASSAVFFWDPETFVFVNAQDHIEILHYAGPTELVNGWEKSWEVYQKLESALEFEFDERLGFLNSSVADIGTGTTLTATLDLPNVNKHEGLKSWASERSVGISHSDSGLLVLNSTVKLGKSAGETLDDFYSTCSEIIEWEKSLQEKPESVTEEQWENFKAVHNEEGANFYAHIDKEGFRCLSKSSYAVFKQMIDEIVDKMHSGAYTKDRTVPEIEDLEVSYHFCAFRNIEGFPYAQLLTGKERQEIEKKIVSVLETWENELKGEYTSLKNLNNLANLHEELFANIDTKAKDWKAFRGVFSASNFFVVVNDLEHCTVHVKGEGNPVQAFSLLMKCLDALESQLEFSVDERLGYIGTDLSRIGTGLLLSVKTEKEIESENVQKTQTGELVFKKVLGLSEAESASLFFEALKQ